MSERELRIAVIGCGFWARFQVAAWRELPAVRITAVCDHDRGRAEALAARFGGLPVYDDAAAERAKIVHRLNKGVLAN